MSMVMCEDCDRSFDCKHDDPECFVEVLNKRNEWQMIVLCWSCRSNYNDEQLRYETETKGAEHA